MRITFLAFFSAALLFLFVGCTDNNLYFQYRSIDAAGWHKDSLCSFEVEIEDNLALYNVYIHLRNTPDYPYQNCWLFLSETMPKGEHERDTIEFYLADQRGRWLGSGVGAAKEMPVLYKQKVQFKESGKYLFQIGHGMRRDKLKGISRVGFRIEKENYGEK